MSKKGLLGWLGRGRQPLPEDDRIAGALLARGVGKEPLARAGLNRHLLQTRLVSTLVEMGEVDEIVGLDALCSVTGQPGVSLRRSLIDLSIEALPRVTAQELLVLPIRCDESGQLVVAAADRMDHRRQQELEIQLGGPIRIHLALHFYLQRAIRAAYELRQEQPDAVFLLGDEVDLDAIPEPAARAVRVAPIAESPTLPDAPEQTPCAVVATPQREASEQTRRWLEELGYRVVLASDGSSALQAIGCESPILIILDALLPGRSGVDIMYRLAAGERFRKCGKLLLSDGLLPVSAGRFATTENLEIVGPGAREIATTTLARRLAAGGQTNDPRLRFEAQALAFSGMALSQENDVDGAEARIREALAHDPLLPLAHLELARLCAQRGARAEAVEAYALAADLGMRDADDAVAMATLLQELGEIDRAASMWNEAGRLAADPETSRQLSAHATRIRRIGTNE